MPSSAHRVKQPIELALLGPKVALQLPVSSLSLEPEQNPGAPGTKPNQTQVLAPGLSMGRECLTGAFSGGSCTDFWGLECGTQTFTAWSGTCCLADCHQRGHGQALIWPNYIYVFSIIPLLTPPLKTGFNHFPWDVWNPITAALANAWQPEKLYRQGKKVDCFHYPRRIKWKSKQTA